jgi:hypothetical protein
VPELWDGLIARPVTSSRMSTCQQAMRGPGMRRLASLLTHAKLVYVAGHGSPGYYDESKACCVNFSDQPCMWRETREPRRAEPRAMHGRRPGERLVARSSHSPAQPWRRSPSLSSSLSSTSEKSDLCLILVFCSVKLEKRKTVSDLTYRFSSLIPLLRRPSWHNCSFLLLLCSSPRLGLGLLLLIFGGGGGLDAFSDDS